MLMRTNMEDSMATRTSNSTGEKLLTPARAEHWLAGLSPGVTLLGFCVLAREAWQGTLAPFDTSLIAGAARLRGARAYDRDADRQLQRLRGGGRRGGAALAGGALVPAPA